MLHSWPIVLSALHHERGQMQDGTTNDADDEMVHSLQANTSKVPYMAPLVSTKYMVVGESQLMSPIQNNGHCLGTVHRSMVLLGPNLKPGRI